MGASVTGARAGAGAHPERCDAAFPGETLRRRIAELMSSDGSARAPGLLTAPTGRRPDGSCSRAAGAGLGEVTLLPHQLAAVRRLARALEEFGGGLLADETGLGKTYVALSIAANAAHTLVVAPAALAPMWSEAMRRTGVRAAFLSTEALSRSCAARDDPSVAHDLLIVDEAQHFRNPRTRRYDALAHLARGARMLLLSATPVHNRARDLHALLALFSGVGSAGLSGAELARCVVRRDVSHLAAGGGPPRVRPPVWLRCGACDAGGALPAAILALPPPIPTRDGGLATDLVARGLVRQWSSSMGALRSALRRRLIRATVLLAHLDAGHHPDAAELRQWAIGDDAVQLPLPGLLADDTAPAPALRNTLLAHLEGVRALLRLTSGCDDGARADALRQVRANHAGAGVVAFSQYADTVRALYATLARDGGVCALHGDTALVAGGVMSRDDALRRFAPRAHGAPAPAPAERITLLLTTDVAAEGFNLQDAAAVVHLDLPWTPALMEQRVGRVARLGSPHGEVATYALSPPPGAEFLLGAERLLHAKWEVTRRTVGVTRSMTGTLPPTDPAAGPGPSPRGAPPEWDEELRARMRRWRLLPAGPVCPGADGTDGPPVGALRVAAGDVPGFLAVVQLEGRRLLLGGLGEHPDASDDPTLLAALAAAADRAAPDVRPTRLPLERARRAIAAWLRHRDASRALALLPPASVPLRRRLLGRVARIVSSTPPHRRPGIVPVAAAARHALATPLGAGTERALATFADARMEDVAWLQALAALAGNDRQGSAGARGAERSPPAPHARRAVQQPMLPGGPELLAILLLVPASGPEGAAPRPPTPPG